MTLSRAEFAFALMIAGSAGFFSGVLAVWSWKLHTAESVAARIVAGLRDGSVVPEREE